MGSFAKITKVDDRRQVFNLFTDGSFSLFASTLYFIYFFTVCVLIRRMLDLVFDFFLPMEKMSPPPPFPFVRLRVEWLSYSLSSVRRYRHEKEFQLRAVWTVGLRRWAWPPCHESGPHPLTSVRDRHQWGGQDQQLLDLLWQWWRAVDEGTQVSPYMH